MKKTESPREAVLHTAEEAVMKQRNNVYGPPTQDFDKIAKAVSVLGFSFDGGPVQSHNVAQFLIVMKLSRTTWSPTHFDSWVDIAGYASCGYECAAEGEEPPVPVDTLKAYRYTSDYVSDTAEPDNFSIWKYVGNGLYTWVNASDAVIEPGAHGTLVKQTPDELLRAYGYVGNVSNDAVKLIFGKLP